MDSNDTSANQQQKETGRDMTMDAKELIQAGQLDKARSLLTEAVKYAPTDLSSRTLLFQALAFSGQWDKARRHLEVIAAQDPDRITAVQTCHDLIQAEIERQEAIRQHRCPAFLPKTPTYGDLYRKAWEDIGKQQFESARTILDDIDDGRPPVSGELNDEPFQGFKDADTRISFVLEVFVHERYVWIPIDSLRELVLPAPTSLLDLIWASAQITTWDGLTVNGYLPVLYPDSHQHDDDRVKLGRMTDWTPLGNGISKGLGQHVIDVGDKECGLLEIRKAVFNSPVSEPSQ
jgi:type VI secretion system protein ImpE